MEKKTPAQEPDIAIEIDQQMTDELPEDIPVEIHHLPEAGGIAWVELHGKAYDEKSQTHQAVKVNLTARAFNSRDALVELMQTIQFAISEYHLYPYMVLARPPQVAQPEPASQPPAPAGTPAPTAIPPTGTPPLAGAPAPTGTPAPIPGQKPEPVYEPLEQNTGEFIAVKMTVTPRDDGKSKLDFFAQGHQYADVSAVMLPEQLAQFLQYTGAWTPDHFKKAGHYEVNYLVRWRNSDRMNRNGKPYKNIYEIRSA